MQNLLLQYRIQRLWSGPCIASLRQCEYDISFTLYSCHKYVFQFDDRQISTVQTIMNRTAVTVKRVGRDSSIVQLEDDLFTLDHSVFYLHGRLLCLSTSDTKLRSALLFLTHQRKSEPYNVRQVLFIQFPRGK